MEPKVTILPIEAMADAWGTALLTTVSLMVVSILVGVSIGIPSALAASLLAERAGQSRFQRGLVSLWCGAMLFGVVTPLILHAAAWESTAGKFGWLVKTMTGGNLLWVGWIHGIHGSALVAVTTFWATRNIPSNALQHSALDFGPVRQWWLVRLPIALRWVVGSVTVVGLLAATEMSVADLHSVRTVADQFYLFYALDPTTTSVLMATLVPLVLGGVPCLIWLRYQRGFVSIDSKPIEMFAASSRVSKTSWLLVGLVIGSMVVCQGAIVFGLLFQAGHSVTVESGRSVASWSLTACVRSLAQAPGMFASEYAWTVQLAGLAVIVVVPTTWLLARCSRTHSKIGRWIDGVMVVVFLIPGPIVAMLVVQTFSSGLAMTERLATQTLIPTLLATSVRSGVLSYLIIRLGYLQISEPVWQSTRLDGGFWFRLMKVELPLLWPIVATASVVVAIVSSGDVPAMLPVLPPGVTTVGTRMFGLLHSGSRYQEASLAFWYFTGLLTIGLVGWRIAKSRILKNSSARE